MIRALALALLLVATPAWAQPIFVQSTSNTGSTTIAFNADMSAENTIIGATAFVCPGGGCGLNVITDSCGNTYYQPPITQISPTAAFVAVFFGRITTGGACTITVSLSGTGTSGQVLAIHEYSNLSSDAFSAAFVDSYKTNSDAVGTTATDGVTSTAGPATTRDNDLVFAVTYLYVADTPLAAGTGFTQREAQTQFMTEDLVLPTSGTVPTGTFTTASSAKPYAVIMVAVLDPSLQKWGSVLGVRNSKLRLR